MEESILPINLVCFYKWSPFLMACLLNRDDLWYKYKEILCCVCFFFSFDAGLSMYNLFRWRKSSLLVAKEGEGACVFVFVSVRMCIHYIMCGSRYKSQTLGAVEAFARGMVDTEADENIGARL